MAKILSITVSGPEGTETHHFRRFPVRIGRGAESDCQLPFAFVSRHHARIEMEEDAAIVYDEGSSHGLLTTDNTRLDTRTRLDAIDGTFRIGLLTLAAVLRDSDEDERSSETLAVAGRPDPTRTYAQDAVDPEDLDEGAARDAFRAALARSRETLGSAVREFLAVHETPRRLGFLREAVREFPELLHVTAVADLLSACGVVAESPQAARAAHAEFVRLARKFVACGGGLASTDEVTAFAERLDTVVDCLLHGTSELLRAYAVETGLPKQDAGAASLGAYLLCAESFDARVGLLRDTFTALEQHHARMVHRVLRGYRTILNELSPAMFESFGFGWFRPRGRWRAFERRHSELSALGPEAFASHFGATFARCLAPLPETCS